MTTYEPLTVSTMAVAEGECELEACEGGICAAQGIRAAGVFAGFRHNPGRKDLALVVADETCTCAATFTQNCFCAAPIQVSRPRAARGKARAVVINSGNANAATGEQGTKVALESAEIVANELGCAPEEVLVASTGVIGVPMSTEPFLSGVPAAAAKLDASAGAAQAAACAIMTTDTHPKESSYRVTTPTHTGHAGHASGAGTTPGSAAATQGNAGTTQGSTAAIQNSAGTTCIHVGGLAKGSGMIQPNMATMLAVVTTDALVSVEAAQAALTYAVNNSFNKVTVDSDTSTNDCCFLLATGKAQGDVIECDSPGFHAFAAGVRAVCEDLARQIAADGEGATKLITVDVMGAHSAEDADTVARSIANSPLVKTAVFGHDANWGRIAAAAGKSGVVFDQYEVDIDFLGVPTCRKGLSVPFDEDDMLKRFEANEIPIVVSLGSGAYATRVWTCDLTHDYVSINADYRT